MTMLRPIFVVAVVAACGGADAGNPPGAPVERDSSGVHIVENPRNDNLPMWKVDSVASVSVGVADGDTNQEFGTIGGIALLNDGMIAVLDGRGETAFEFRIFDSTGKHVARHGRFGQGPGEFTWVNNFGSTAGDTIFAVDFPNRRLNYLTVSRGYVRSLPIDEIRLKELIAADASGLAEVMVPFDDSSYAITAFRPKAGATTHFERFKSFHVVNLRTGVATELARHDETRGKPLAALASKRMSVYPVERNEPTHVVDRARQRICVAVTSRTEISCLDVKGQRLVVRWRTDSIPFTDTDRTRYGDRMREGMGRGNFLTPAELDAYIGALEFPEWFNPFTVLRLDDAGNFWILERIRGTDGKQAERFRIIDASGKQIAFANAFPARNIGLGSQQYFGKDAILRIYEADDVQKVGVFRIRRP